MNIIILSIIFYIITGYSCYVTQRYVFRTYLADKNISFRFYCLITFILFWPIGIIDKLMENDKYHNLERKNLDE